MRDQQKADRLYSGCKTRTRPLAPQRRRPHHERRPHHPRQTCHAGNSPHPNRGESIADRAQSRIRNRCSHSTRNRSVHSPPDPPNPTTRPPQPRRSAAPTSASPNGAAAWMHALWRRTAEAAAIYIDRWTPRTQRPTRATEPVLGHTPQLPPARQAEYDHAAAAANDAINAITHQIGPHNVPTRPSATGPDDWISGLEQSPSMLDDLAALHAAAQDAHNTITAIQTDLDDYNAVSAIGLR